jgi:hypothetical protein
MKPLRGLELVAAGLWVAPWLVIAITGSNLKSEDDSWLLPLWIGGGVLAGFLCRSWWVAALLSLLVVGTFLLSDALHPCVDGPQNPVECDENGTYLAVFFFLPLTLLIAESGVVIRKALGFVGRRLRPDLFESTGDAGSRE